MALNLENLDEATRPFMLQEFEADVAAGRLYPSRHFSGQGSDRYPTLMREALERGTDETLGAALSAPGLFNSHYTKKTPKGGTTQAAVPHNVATTFAEGEFNRFYIRGLCLRAAGGTVEVYRARPSKQARPESEALIGQVLDAGELLEDLRTHIGEAPTLLPYVNSGLSVRLPSP